MYNILKTWVASHFHDFEADATLLEHFIEFVQGDLKQTGMELAAESLFKLIQRAVSIIEILLLIVGNLDISAKELRQIYNLFLLPLLQDVFYQQQEIHA